MPQVPTLVAPDTGPSGDAGCQTTIDALGAHVALLDEQLTVVAVNAAWTAFSEGNGGAAGTTGVGSSYLDACRWARPDDAAEILLGLRDVLAGRRDLFVSTAPCHTPTESRWFELRATPFGADGDRLLVQYQDVTTHHRAEESARVCSLLLDSVDAAVTAVDADGVVVYWSDGARRAYGWTREQAVGRHAATLALGHAPAPAEPSWEGELELRHRDGSRFPAHLRTAPMADPQGGPSGSASVVIDITARREAARALRSAKESMAAVAASMDDGVCVLDPAGRVEYLNPRGEELLGWRADDLVGHDFHAAAHHAHADGTPYPAADCPLVRARRAGGAVRIEEDTLIRRDGTLLPVQQVLTPFEAEHGVRGSVVVFSDITDRLAAAQETERKLEDLAWIERIRVALDEDRFVLHAQPIVELRTGATVQHELLIRMRDEAGAMVPPGLFLPVAEAYGLIGEIDRWVVSRGMELAARGHPIELNLSAWSLGDPTLALHVEAELERTGADPATIVFELTETALLQDEEAALRFITAVVAKGCKLALDDFGTGYGGFGYLKRLPVAYLKIDIEFVRDLTTEPASRQVVEAVVNLARGFRIATVAEGVEDAETMALLDALGVDFVQGYHLGRPAPLDATFDAGSR